MGLWAIRSRWRCPHPSWRTHSRGPLWSLRAPSNPQILWFYDFLKWRIQSSTQCLKIHPNVFWRQKSLISPLLVKQPSREGSACAPGIFLLLTIVSPMNKNPKSALVEFPGCSLKAILLRVHVAAISSNNVCIVQGANRELCCHHPLEWVVPSDFQQPQQSPEEPRLAKIYT